MIESVLKQLKKVAWFLPGFLLWASFPPMGEMTDCLFALAPLLWLARQREVKRNVKIWFLNGLLFWVATLSWMPAIVKNGGPWPLVVLGWGALAAYCALYFAAYGYLVSSYWSWVRGDLVNEPHTHYGWRLLGLLVIEPILWAGLELVRSRLGGGFAWNQLGIAGVNAGFGSPAAWGGVYLVSALIILVNGTIASIAERVFRQGAHISPWVRPIETVLPLLLIWGCFAGVQSCFGAREEQSPLSLRVGLIQRNFPSVFERNRKENPLQVYEGLSRAVSYTKPDLLVLPESALCEVSPIDSPRAQAFADWLCEQTGARAVLAGGNRVDGDRQYNSVGLYLGQNSPQALQIYDKVHLVPFGEFIPGDKCFPILQRLAPVGSCTPGKLKLLSLDLPGLDAPVRLGVAICYEDTDSAQMRRLAALGAEALIFVTNDSWFSQSDETVSHAWQAVARAIETGLPVVRVGNSGVTGVIEPNGKATWLINEEGQPLVDAAGSMSATIDCFKCVHNQTLYTIFGDIPLFVFFLLILIGMGVVRLKQL